MSDNIPGAVERPFRPSLFAHAMCGNWKILSNHQSGGGCNNFKLTGMLIFAHQRRRIGEVDDERVKSEISTMPSIEIPESRHYAPGVPIILVGTKLGFSLNTCASKMLEISNVQAK